jgi:alpha-L-rhamnosidase
MRVE